MSQGAEDDDEEEEVEAVMVPACAEVVLELKFAVGNDPGDRRCRLI